MLRINQVIKEKGYVKSELATLARIPQNDFYQATNGKKTFFPSWRKRIAEVLDMTEDELFPEYIKKEG